MKSVDPRSKNKKNDDPYFLDFTKLRKEYMEETSQKLKFSKPSFLHYCKNPYIYDRLFGGDDTILTMELIQAPNGLKFKDILEATEIIKRAKAKAKQDLIAKKKELKLIAFQLKKEAALKEKKRLETIKEALKKKYGDDAEEDDDEEEDDDISDDEVSENEDDSEDASNILKDKESGVGGGGEDEPEYNGDMFKNNPREYALSDHTI